MAGNGQQWSSIVVDGRQWPSMAVHGRQWSSMIGNAVGDDDDDYDDNDGAVGSSMAVNGRQWSSMVVNGRVSNMRWRAIMCTDMKLFS